MNPNRASEVSAIPRLAMTSPPPHKKALQTAKMTAVAMMRLLYNIRSTFRSIELCARISCGHFSSKHH